MSFLRAKSRAQFKVSVACERPCTEKDAQPINSTRPAVADLWEQAEAARLETEAAAAAGSSGRQGLIDSNGEYPGAVVKLVEEDLAEAANPWHARPPAGFRMEVCLQTRPLVKRGVMPAAASLGAFDLSSNGGSWSYVKADGYLWPQ